MASASEVSRTECSRLSSQAAAVDDPNQSEAAGLGLWLLGFGQFGSSEMSNHCETMAHRSCRS